MIQPESKPLYRIHVEAVGENYHHLPHSYTQREVQVVAHRIGVDGFFTNEDAKGDFSYIPAHRIKRVVIVRDPLSS